MRSSLVADVIVHSQRPDLLRLATEYAKMKGVSNVLAFQTSDNCMDALSRFPKGLLIIDWELGAVEVVKVLSYSRRLFHGLRTIMLVAPKVSEQVVATAAEYSVTQIFTEELTARNLGARLSALVITETMPDEIKQSLTEVYVAREGGDLKNAVQILQKLLTKHPTNLRLKCEAAETLMQLGENEKALQVLAGIENSKPPYLRGIHLLGRVQMKLGRFDEALMVLNQANLFNPHDVDRLVDIGQSLLNLDRVREAADQFDGALGLDPTNRLAKVGLGQCELMDGHVNEALEILKEVSGEVEMASLFNICAVMNMRQGRHEAGMNLYQSALRALGKNTRVQARLCFNMGLGYRRWGKRDKAQEAFAQALRLDPRYSRAQEQINLIKELAAKPNAEADNLSAGSALGIETLMPADMITLMDEDLQEEGLSQFPNRLKPA